MQLVRRLWFFAATWVCLAASTPAFWLFFAAERSITTKGGGAVVNVAVLSRPSVG